MFADSSLEMADEDPFGLGEPPAAPQTDDFGDSFGEAPPMAEGSMGEPPSAMPDMGMMGEPSPMDGMGAPPPMDGGMGDMSGGMDMGGGMSGGMDMGGMGGGMSAMSGTDFGAPMEVGAVAKWRMERDEKVAAKAAASREAEAAKIAEAKAALETFYAERAEKVSKRAAENRAAEAAYVEERDAAMIADSWDSVCKLVDLKEKAGAEVDMSRMRSLLTQLKHS